MEIIAETTTSVINRLNPTMEKDWSVRVFGDTLPEAIAELKKETIDMLFNQTFTT